MTGARDFRPDYPISRSISLIWMVVIRASPSSPAAKPRSLSLTQDVTCRWMLYRPGFLGRFDHGNHWTA